MKAFSALRNISTEVTAGRVAQKDRNQENGAPYRYELEDGTAFPGYVLSFGQMVKYLVEPQRGENEVQLKFGPKVREAVFMGYKFTPGCVWKKECVVVDWKMAKKAEHLRSAAVGRVREIEKLPTKEYPFITRVKELSYPRLFVHSDAENHDDEDAGVTPQDVGVDFEIAPDAGGVDPSIEEG